MEMFVLILLCGSIGVLIFCLLKLACIIGLFGKYGQLTLGHNYGFNKMWNTTIIKTLDGYDDNTVVVDDIDDYSITFSNGVSVWIANKYYAYGAQRSIKGRVSLKTALRLIKIEKEALVNNGILK